MSDEVEDKKHDASSKKLSELRKQGTVLRSRDLSGGLIFVLAVGFIAFTAENFKVRIKNDFIISFYDIRKIMTDDNLIIDHLKSMVSSNFDLILPVFLGTFLAAFLAPFLFGGWNFTLDVFQLKLTKMNPVNNLKNILSLKKTSLEVLRSFFKSSFIMSVFVLYFYVRRHDIVKLVNLEPVSAMNTSFFIVREFIFFLSGSLVILVLVDMISHFYQFKNQTKMSQEEVKEEHKQLEGNPQIKRKIRSRQIALLKQRLQSSVPKANVIVTNPTHYAVALRYDEFKDRAPVVVAKGKDLIAQQIRSIATSNDVPIYEAPELARAIYHTTQLGVEIQPALYMAVAIVLSYVNQLRNYQQGIGQAPKYIEQLEIPQEFIYPD